MDDEMDRVDAYLAGTALLVETSNPYDPTHEDLEELLSELQTAAAGRDVEIVYAPDEIHGAGVTHWHMVYVWLPNLDAERDALWAAAITSGLAYLRRWRRKRPKELTRNGEVRILYGPDGEVLTKIVVPAGEVEPKVVPLAPGEEKRPLWLLRRTRKRSK